jgi:PKHD-type hydroxylase
MLVAVPDVLDAERLACVRAIVDRAEWVDGGTTAGHQAVLAKRNRQIPEESPAAQEAGALILDALARHPLFIAAALPLRIYPPMFNSYEGGETFGVHVDSAVRIRRGTDTRVRTDLSATLFLADPEDYDGGELTIEGHFGAQQVKLPAGHMILYPASSLHRVEPVTRGRRLGSFFWIQSMIRDTEARRTLFEMDTAIQAIAQDRGQDDPAIVQLTGVYHNLLRRWADS